MALATRDGSAQFDDFILDGTYPDTELRWIIWNVATEHTPHANHNICISILLLNPFPFLLALEAYQMASSGTQGKLRMTVGCRLLKGLNTFLKGGNLAFNCCTSSGMKLWQRLWTALSSFAWLHFVFFFFPDMKILVVQCVFQSACCWFSLSPFGVAIHDFIAFYSKMRSFSILLGWIQSTGDICIYSFRFHNNWSNTVEVKLIEYIC